MDASPYGSGVEGAENLQAEASDGSPADNWYMQGMPDMTQELNSIHAANANCAAFHADVAAKHAASLAQWVQYLWGQIGSLQGKVIELEDWKRKTLDDMTKLRFEHKLLRRKVAPEEEEALGLPGKAKSLPLLLADHMEPGVDGAGQEKRGKKAQDNAAGAAAATPSSVRPPPGLVEALADAGAAGSDAMCTSPSGKSLRFAPPGDASPSAAAPPAALPPAAPEGRAGPPPVFRSLDSTPSSLPEATHVTDVPEEGLLEGVSVVPGMSDCVECEVAQWRIGNLSMKLRGCMGRALVSSPFSMWGLKDLRLMVCPDGKEVAKGPRSRRQKELYAKKVSEGPLEGCLKLKVPDCPAPHVLEYHLKIGSCKKGPFKHNFAESTVNGCLDFGIDWLKHVEPDSSLIVTLELLKRGAVEHARGSGVSPDDA